MKKRKQKTSNNSNKYQLLGLFLMGLSALLFLTIISYNLDDPINVNIEDNPVTTHNWLGPLGAAIAHYIMQWTFGYAALFFPVILMIVGYLVFLNQSLLAYMQVFSKIFGWALLISILLALPAALKSSGNLIEYYPSGLIGGWIAAKLVLYLGKIGSVLLLAFISMLLLFATINFEVNRFINVIFQFLSQVKAFFSAKLSSIKIHLAERKEQRLLAMKLKEENAALELEPEISTHDGKQIPVEKEDQNESIIPNIEPEFTPELNTGNEQGFDLEEQPVPEAGQTTLPGFDTPEDLKDVDFELKEEVKEEELDYDDLVKESIAQFKFPSINLLNNPPKDRQTITKEELKANAQLLEYKLLDYGVKAKVVRVTAGPVITLYELQPAAGVKVSSIVSLENDLALAMEARGIRIIAPIPGKAAVGIEIPNRFPQMVYLKSLIRSEKFSQGNFELPLAVGKAINGESFIVDLTKMPHLLIAGATGAGKSVGINTIICSLLYSVNPGKVKFVMIDPKKLELSLYRDLRDHYLLWRPDLDEEVITKPNNAVSILNTMVLEMERRQERMHKMGARNIREYNAKIQKSPHLYKKTEHQNMPYIVVIIDELADLMMVAAKEVELPIARLAQMARAGGIHMIVATQRPSVDVITGLIKANLPARLAYQVATKVDSRTILDANGADQLLGNGDLLFKITGTTKPIRLQNPFVATEEVEMVINHIKKQPKLPYYSLPQPSESRRESFEDGFSNERDPLYEDARAIVVNSQQGSISLLQRRLKIGYSRAARLIDEMEEEGIVGAAIGGKPREVLMTLQELNQIS